MIQVLEEILSKVFKWHRFHVSIKAEDALLYSKGLSLRAVREFLIAIWFHMNQTKIKARAKTYYPWLAVDQNGLRWNGYMRLLERGMWSFEPLKTGN